MVPNHWVCLAQQIMSAQNAQTKSSNKTGKFAERTRSSASYIDFPRFRAFLIVRILLGTYLLREIEYYFYIPNCYVRMVLSRGRLLICSVPAWTSYILQHCTMTSVGQECQCCAMFCSFLDNAQPPCGMWKEMTPISSRMH